MSNRAEVGVEGEEAAAADLAAPVGALAQAAEKEQARVTLYRALRTLARMLVARGYVVTMIGSAAVASAEDALVVLEQYREKERAEVAEVSHEIVLEAVVAPVPEKFTTAWAVGAPPDSKLIVVVIDQGNVDTMREINDAMVELEVASAILLSRKDLTAYSKKYLLDPKNTVGTIQHFQYAELQAAIMDHRMQPRHLPLNADMAMAVRKRYEGGIFPRLMTFDPMVRFLGLAVGTVVAVREAYGKDQATMTYFEVSDVY